MAQQALADFLLADGRMVEAIAHYQVALRQNPGSAPTHNNLAVAYINLERFDEGLRELDHAQKIDPSFSENFEKLKAYLKTRP